MKTLTDQLNPPDQSAHPDAPASESKSAPVLVLTPKPVAPAKFDPTHPPAEKSAPKKNQQEEPQAFPFSVTVGQVYDGPMDLLLDLIRKQDIDIYDIPIAKITAQFLGYVEKLKSTDRSEEHTSELQSPA